MEVVEQKVNALIERRGDLLTCTPCGKTMPLEKKWAIRRHAEVHLEGMSFPCDTCGKLSKTSKGLSNHKWKYHRPNTATKTVPYIPNGTNLATLSNTTALAVKYESNGSSTVNVKYEPQDTANSLMSGDESSEAGDERHQHHHRQL